jgi:Rad52/22 family double-strand break repair protein
MDTNGAVKGKARAEGAVEHGDVYARLAAPFDATFRDIRGGVDLEYITGEQAISRLNETLGVAGWSFRVLEHGINAEADECWVLGEITATFGQTTVTRQQFGSQKVKRSRASGTPLDIGFDLKGAATDALKKCASLLGVALYLWKKEAPPDAAAGETAATVTGEPEALLCEEGGDQLTETRFKDGTNWAPAQLAGFGRRKHSRVLCMTHYRDANQAKRRAEEALQTVPF